MAINLYRSRRGKFFKCRYWKRNTVGFQDNEELYYMKAPDGIFYAKISSSRGNAKQEVANVFQFGYDELTIQTEDIVKIDANDIIEFDNCIWIAERVNDEIVQKNAQFSCKTSRITTIVLRKGENNG